MGSNKKFIMKKPQVTLHAGGVYSGTSTVAGWVHARRKGSACPFHPAHEELLKRRTCPAGEDALPRARWGGTSARALRKCPGATCARCQCVLLSGLCTASHRPASSDTCLDSAGPPGDTSWACREPCGRSPRTPCAQKQEDEGIQSSTELPCDAWRHTQSGGQR